VAEVEKRLSVHTGLQILPAPHRQRLAFLN
jgi:hypothetical protein